MDRKEIKLLAIDDEEQHLDALQAAVRHAFPDSVLFTARNGTDGIETARAEVPDAILLDIIMPGMDGFEICRRLKEDPRLKSVPVVFLTAIKPDKEICDKALAAGAEAFLSKPFELWELTIQLRTMLKIRKANLAQRAERDKLRLLVADRTRMLDEQLALREKALQSLQESESLFKAVFDGAPLGICLLDAGTGRFLKVNQRLACIAGRPRAELLGTDWMAITHPDDVEPQRRHMEELLSGETEVISTQKRYLRRDGGQVWVKLTATRLPSCDKAPVRYLGMVEDISAAKAAAAEKAQLEEQLRQAQKMEIAGTLAGGIAHDFNNILAAILSYADFVLDAMTGEDPRRGDVEEIQKAGLRAAALTKQLLAFSRKQVLLPRVLDVNEAISGMEPMLRRLIGENIRLKALRSEGRAPIMADPGYLEQVIMNLAVNARDAMPEGGDLTLEVSLIKLDSEYTHRHCTIVPGDYVLLSVSDTGCGMSEEIKERIFEPFFTTKPRDKGTGLGLSTVHGIVKQSGGAISVYSEAGRGSVFKIYFPRACGEPAPAAAPAASPRKHETGKGTVLIVDDDLQIRTLSRRALSSAGLDVLEASSAEEALQLIGQGGKRADILLTDMVLPKMSGIDLAGQLAGMTPGIGVIYMSGYTDHSVLVSGSLPPDITFIEKPFPLESLIHKVMEKLHNPAKAPSPPKKNS